MAQGLAAQTFSSGVHDGEEMLGWFFVMAKHKRTLSRTKEGAAASLPGDAFPNPYL